MDHSLALEEGDVSNTPAISRGSLVRIKDGLPPGLRVLAVSDGQDGSAAAVAVSWWGTDGRLRRAVLPADVLEPSQAPAAPPVRDIGMAARGTAGKA